MTKEHFDKQFVIGGTTYCALASLYLAPHATSTKGSNAPVTPPERDRLIRWLTQNQKPVGGFSGRTGKLADACYCFWCGASLKVSTNQVEYNSSHTNNNLRFWVWRTLLTKLPWLRFSPSVSSNLEALVKIQTIDLVSIAENISNIRILTSHRPLSHVPFTCRVMPLSFR